MSRTSRYAFILAKMYGVIARSYVGKNFRDLLRLKKLTELSDLLFPGEHAETPAQNLAVDLEARIVRARIDSMEYVLSSLKEPVEILVHILRKLEYQGLKSVIRVLASGQGQPGRIWDLGPYAAVHLAGAKDYEKEIRSSPYSWILPHLKNEPLVQVENRLDSDYYTRLFQLAHALPSRDRMGVLRLVGLEITLANVIWALRLRFFYSMDADRAGALLIPGLGKAQRETVMAVFTITPDSVEEWRRWKFGWLLEDQLGDSFRSPDPVRAEQKAAQRLYLRAHQLFHQDPFTLVPLVAYFKLKEYEADLLKTAVEAMKLSIPEQEVLAITGVR
jgi:vacuolar-type H+-ATPase subunit C/Vma6